MSYQRRILMSQQNADTSLSEVYAYANSVGITPQQVNSAIGNNTDLIERLIAWKYLLHSLIDTGYTPWLKGDGVAYIVTNIRIADTSTVNLKIQVLDSFYRCAIFGSRTSATENAIYVGETIYRRLYYQNYSSDIYGIISDWGNYLTSRIGATYQANQIYDIQIGKTSSINGDTHTYENLTFLTPTGAYIFNTYNAPSGHPAFNGRISSVSIADAVQGIDAKFVPYLYNGTYGMLDIESNTFFASAVQNGRFSYELWDGNGNQVNIN